MKKLTSAILVVVLTVTCMFAPMTSATTIEINTESAVSLLLTLLGENMPETQQQRVDVFNTMAMYMSTDANMENLINIVADLDNYIAEFETRYPTENELSFADQTTLQGQLDVILFRLKAELGGWDTLLAQKDSMLFVLCLLQALPADDRNAAIDDFRDAQEANDVASDDRGPWGPELLVNPDEDFQAALEDIYLRYVGEEAQTKLGTHGLGPNTILRLSQAFRDNMMLTDGGDENFALKSMGTDFEARLNEIFPERFAEINGVELTDSNASEVVMDAVVAMMNTIPDSLEESLKHVLGDDTVGLYELTDVEPTPTPTPTPTKKPSSSSNSSGTGGIIVVPKPPVSTPSAPPLASEEYVYPDTENHWAKDYIAELSKEGIFVGYEDGNFRPDWDITREEIAVAMTRMLGLEDEAASAPVTNFTDNDEISAWAKDDVNKMVEIGVYTGYDDNYFRPHKIITREELSAVIIRMLGDDVVEGSMSYIDRMEIGPWARDYVAKATALAIVEGYPDKTFKPRQAVTRAEAAKMLRNLQYYLNNQ